MTNRVSPTPAAAASRSSTVSAWALVLATTSCVLGCNAGVSVNQPGDSGARGSGGMTGSGGDSGSGSGGLLTPGSGGAGAPGSGGAAVTGGRSGSASGGAPGSGGATATGGTLGTGGRGTTGTGGGAGTGAAGRAGTGGGPGSTGGASGTGGATPTGGVSGGCSANCGTHRWACWPMPNPVSSGLPNPASYTDLGDGTVRDNVTCLTWEKTVSATSYTVAAGRTYCAGKGAGWRLATRIELMSILDYAKSGAKADATAFPSTPAAFFKTGSEWVLTTKQIGAGAGKDFGWAFNFSDGIVSNARSGATADRARCVRGGGDGELDAAPAALSVAPPNQYTMIATGEVQDNYTGLIWQQASSATQMTFADAKTYCTSLGLNGKTWRLPSIREASTLVDEAQVAPSINRTMFPGTKYGSKSNNWYWAGHNSQGSTTAAWAINFDDGFTGANTATDTAAWNYFTTVWARCVR